MYKKPQKEKSRAGLEPSDNPKRRSKRKGLGPSYGSRTRGGIESFRYTKHPEFQSRSSPSERLAGFGALYCLGNWEGVLGVK
jgi:hypothetical protein